MTGAGAATGDPSGREALARIREGGKPALARALAAIEVGWGSTGAGSAETAALLDAALAETRAHVLGLTGPPGVGKSTLTDALIRAFRARGRTVGVIAVDPSSRASGGALLGDRTRLTRDPSDDGVFVRSMAARDRLGGLAAMALPVAVLMGAVFDLLIVETVGVGQSETGIADLADTVVFCAQPGSGDALQFMKAGVMEIPDVVLVTKSDMGETARRTVADLRGALSLLAGRDAVAVLACSAARGEGLDEVAEALLARAGALPAEGLAARRREQAAGWLAEALEADFGRIGLRRLASGRLPLAGDFPFAAARTVHEGCEAALRAVAAASG